MAPSRPSGRRDGGDPPTGLSARRREALVACLAALQTWGLLAPFAFIIVTGMTTTWVAYVLVPAEGLRPAVGFLASIFWGTALLDVLLGQWSFDLDAPRSQRASRSFLVRILPMVGAMTVPVGILSVSVLIGTASTLSLTAFLTLAAIVGILSGAVGLVCSHELIHRRSRLDQGVGVLTLCFVSYPCFYREHVYGHHVHVGTPDDPATARLGESVYRFLPRAVLGCMRNSWRIEAELRARSARRGQIHVTAVSWIVVVGIVLALWMGASKEAAGFFLLQSLFAITVLETVNYVQHYALERRRETDGAFESVKPSHAFNAPFWFSNVAFLNLMLHSDHHCFERRPFPILRRQRGAPSLPLPAFTMILIAYLPPLWFALMDRRALAANAG